MNPVQKIKALIRYEISLDKPNFALLNTYQQALREALARDGHLSVADAGGENSLIGGIAVGHAGVRLAHQGQIIQEQEEDNHLVATTGVPGPDPFTALLASWPYIVGLYPDEEERENVRNHLRAEINRRLGLIPPSRTKS